jgi:hypothetical protein
LSRLAQLRARREQLRARCAEQREEIVQAVAGLRAHGQSAGGAAARAARNPLAWLALLAGLTFLPRAHRVLSLLLVLGSAVSLARRAGTVLRMLGSWGAARAPGAGARAPTAGERP